MLKNTIVRLGHIRAVLFITFISILMSFLIYLLVSYILNIPITLKTMLLTLIIPIIVTPLVLWYLSKLILQIMGLESKIKSLATIDSLTGLLTRQTFLNRIDSIYEVAKRNKTGFVILYMDVDNFKSINDTYGHNIGDKVLQSLGEIVTKNKRSSDLVGRVGGKEFVYALPDIDLEGAKYFAEKIRKMIENNLFDNKGVYISYTISIGISIYSQKNQVELDKLIAQADHILHLAKESGKNCVKVYSID